MKLRQTSPDEEVLQGGYIVHIDGLQFVVDAVEQPLQLLGAESQVAAVAAERDRERAVREMYGRERERRMITHAQSAD